MNLEPYLSATPSSCITPRIVWSLLTEILVLILTIILAMIDTSDFTQAFFYIRLGLILAIILAMIDTSDFPQVWAKSLWNSRYILIYTYIYIIYIQCGNIYIYMQYDHIFIVYMIVQCWVCGCTEHGWWSLSEHRLRAGWPPPLPVHRGPRPRLGRTYNFEGSGSKK